MLMLTSLELTEANGMFYKAAEISHPFSRDKGQCNKVFLDDTR